MRVALALRAALAEAHLRGRDPGGPAESGAARRFGRILGAAVRTWTAVGEAVAAEDFDGAVARLRARTTAADDAFARDVGLAADSRGLGHRLASDDVLFALAAVLTTLRHAETAPRDAIEGVVGDAHELAVLRELAPVLGARAGRTRTGWGRRRLERRLAAGQARAAALMAGRDARVLRARQLTNALAADLDVALALFEAAFTGEPPTGASMTGPERSEEGT